MENEMITQIFGGILAIIIAIMLIIACIVLIYCGFRQDFLENQYLSTLSDEEYLLISKYKNAKKLTSDNLFPKKENKNKEE